MNYAAMETSFHSQGLNIHVFFRSGTTVEYTERVQLIETLLSQMQTVAERKATEKSKIARRIEQGEEICQAARMSFVSPSKETTSTPDKDCTGNVAAPSEAATYTSTKRRRDQSQVLEEDLRNSEANTASFRNNFLEQQNRKSVLVCYSLPSRHVLFFHIGFCRRKSVLGSRGKRGRKTDS